MDLFSNLALGFDVAFSLDNLLYCFVGALLGTAIGVLPGVGPLVTISVLLPMTFSLPPEGALIMLAGIYYGAAYGGSTTAILVNLPGESSSVVTALDGYAMAQQGRAGTALSIAAISSLVAGCIGTVLIALFAAPLASAALSFGPAEYFSLMLLALVLSASLVHGPLIKGIAMALIGILVGLAGTDVTSGIGRFTFGISGLIEGVDFVVLAMGLFAITEIIATLEDGAGTTGKTTTKVSRLMPSLADLRASLGATLRGTGIGAFTGVLPGAGQIVASFAAYAVERRVSRDPQRFGKGAIEGVAAPEAANNAAAQTSFIPTLTLGIPGSGTMALMLGALMIQGVTPGPQIISQHAPLFWGLVVSMFVGNLMLVILNLPLVGIWVRLLKVPYRWLYPTILTFSTIGVYSVLNDPLGVYLAIFFGLAGYLFRKLGCEVAPLILGFLLGPMIEENFRRALMFSRGSPSIFFESPISVVFLAAALLAVLLMIIPSVRRKKNEAAMEG